MLVQLTNSIICNKMNTNKQKSLCFQCKEFENCHSNSATTKTVLTEKCIFNP